MSVVSGDAVASIREMEEKEVVEECMKVLRELFKEQVSPSYVRYKLHAHSVGIMQVD